MKFNGSFILICAALAGLLSGLLASPVFGRADGWAGYFAENDERRAAAERPYPEDVFSFSVTVTDASCKGGQDGAIEVAVDGGQPPYKFKWSNGATTQNLTNVPAGEYTFTLTDAVGFTQAYYKKENGRYVRDAKIIVKEPNTGVNVMLAPEPPKCAGQRGNIRVNVTQGQPPYTYAWSTGGSSPELTQAPAGDYSVTVTDAKGCSGTAAATLKEPLELNVNATGFDARCADAKDGKISVIASGGTKPYAYKWSNGSSARSLDGVAPGAYSLTLSDANGCSAVASANVGAPEEMTLVMTPKSASCGDVKNGEVKLEVEGGAPPYQFKWSNGAASQNLTGLPAGSFTVTVTDAKGCSAIRTATVDQPAGLSISNLKGTNPLCHGQANGAVEVELSGGTEPFQYAWSNGSTQPKLIRLGPGSYSVTITDANGCKATATTTLKEPAKLELKTQVFGADCNNRREKPAAEASATGGTPPYSFRWSGGKTGQRIEDVPTGKYTVTVQDSYGCEQTETIELKDFTPIKLTGVAKSVGCAGPNSGGVTVGITGGKAPFQFKWSNGGAQKDLQNVPAGKYTLTVTDADGCEKVEKFEVPAYEQLKIETQTAPVTCFDSDDGSITAVVTGGKPPYRVSWSNGSGEMTIRDLPDGDYTVQVRDELGCEASSKVTLSRPEKLEVKVNKTDPPCGGGAVGKIEIDVTGGAPPYEYNWSNGARTKDVQNLPGGPYTVTVKDKNGCTAIGSALIIQAKSFNLQLEAVFPSCANTNDGKITAVSTGGKEPYQYKWSNGKTGAEVKGLAPGKYTVTATDANGCAQTKVQELSAPAPLKLTVQKQDILCGTRSDGKASASVEGGTAPHTFKWSTGATGPDVATLAPGNYTLSVTDGQGCSESQDFEITRPEPLKLELKPEDLTCGGTSDGKIAAVVSGGKAPYKFAWSDGSQEQNILAAPQGAYTLTVTDANGCETTQTATLTKPEGMSIELKKTDLTCSGENDGKAEVDVEGGTAPFQFKWSNGGTGRALTGLPAGKISVTVTDAMGCVSTAAEGLDKPVSVNLTVKGTDISCAGRNDGKAQAIVSGGTPPVTLSWNTGATGESLSNLAAGTYTLNLSDASGCRDSATVRIKEPTALSVKLTAKNVSCGGANDGELAATVSGGTEPYAYKWSSAQASAKLTGLDAGAYTVTVTDKNGCTASATETLTRPGNIDLNVSGENLSCSGEADGSAKAIIAGGAEPYKIKWSNGATTAEVRNLPKGRYAVTVTDANGCEATDKLTLEQPPQLVLKTSKTDVTCAGEADGTAKAVIAGGTEPFSISWSSGQTEAEISGLKGGSYTVAVTDGKGCKAEAKVEIVAPKLLLLTLEPKNVSCGGDADGAIKTQVSGGVEPYKYQWSSGQTTANLTGLGAGDYSVTVTDKNGCAETKSATLTKPGGIVLKVSGENLTCSGENDGSAKATIAGGAEPYKIKWSNGATTETIQKLGKGEYSVTVTDKNGCTASDKVTLTQPPAIVLKAKATDVTCAGRADGTAKAIIAGGTEPFTVSWSNGGSETELSGLSGGKYTVTVSDASNCTAKAEVEISEPKALSVVLDATNVSCGGDADGALKAQVSGGIEPYKYKWSSGQTTANLTGLDAGDYALTVTDKNGCEAKVSETLTRPGNIVLKVSGENLTCSGENDGSAKAIIAGGTEPYKIKWSNGATTETIQKLGKGEYSVTVTDKNGCAASDKVTLTQPPKIVLKASATDVTCAGRADGTAKAIIAGGTEPFTVSWSAGGSETELSGLSGGKYTVSVSDASNCSAKAEVEISEPKALSVVLDATNVSCGGDKDGALKAQVSGGTEPYKYKWSSGQTTANLTGLDAGDYALTVTDKNGCEAKVSETLTRPGNIVLKVSGENLTCSGENDGSAKAEISGGTEPYSVKWSNGATTSAIQKLGKGEYSVTVTDKNGCTASDKVTLTQPPAINLKATATDVTCASKADGTAKAAISGGTAPFVVKWNTGRTEEEIKGLKGGKYSVAVSDAKNCKAEAEVEIEEPAKLTVSLETEPVSCSGKTDGKVAAKVEGGVEPYAYAWSNEQKTAALKGLGAGAYVVTVTDKNGCEASERAMLEDPPSMKLTVRGVDLTCYEGKDGKASVTVEGGTKPYAYAWSSGAKTAEAENLPAGKHTVTVTDKNGCNTSETAELAQPQQPEINVTGSLKLCKGGSVLLDAQAGYRAYAWSSGQTTQAIRATEPGTYKAKLTAQNGCQTETKPVTVETAPPPKIPTISEDGASLKASAAKEYQWYFNNAPMQGETGQTITPHRSGNYSIKIADENGCEAMSAVKDYTSPEEAARRAQRPVVNLYPNPNSGEFNLAMSNVKQNMTVQIVGPDNKVYFKKELTRVSADFTEKIDVKAKQGPPGTYVLVIESEFDSFRSTIQVTD